MSGRLKFYIEVDENKRYSYEEVLLFHRTIPLNKPWFSCIECIPTPESYFYFNGPSKHMVKLSLKEIVDLSYKFKTTVCGNNLHISRRDPSEYGFDRLLHNSVNRS